MRCAVFALALALAVGTAHGQDRSVAEIESSLASARAEIAALGDLAAEEAAIRSQADAFAPRLRHYKEEGCKNASEYKDLVEVQRYITARCETWHNNTARAKMLEGQVQSLTLQLSSAKAKAAAALALPMVDPRDMITQSMYDAAKRDLARLDALHRRLAEKLEQLSRWKSDLVAHSAEFDELRRDSQRDLVYDFLDHVPMAGALKKAKDLGYISRGAEAEIKAGYDAMKALIIADAAMTNTDKDKQAALVTKAVLALRKSMLALPVSKANDEVRRFLDATAKVYDTGVKAFVYAEGPNKGPEQLGRMLVSLGELAYPPSGLVVLTFDGAERVGQAWSASVALESLGAAMGQNWNAELYLTERREGVQVQIKEVQRLVDGYESRRR